jgi:CubicO group peptidase (beta-lactamase class C family)
MRKAIKIVLCNALCLFSGVNLYALSQPVDSGKKDSGSYIHDETKRNLFESQMDEYIANQMKAINFAGLSIVVVENDRVIYNKGFGFADKEKGISAGPSTLFHIGSITKLFTGIGIMQLVQKGLIDIDAPIERYLPEFSIKRHDFTRRPITIRSIMAHQSGIFAEKMFHWSDSVYPSDDFRTFPEFARNEYAAYTPNYITAYSNFAVSILGLVIERVSHQKYEDYIASNILKPCRMDKTSFDPKKNNEDLLATGYDVNGNVCPYNYIAGNPAGFLASSADDMANFIKMILHCGYFNKHEILSSAVLSSMYQAQNTYLPMRLNDEYEANRYGLSLKIKAWII